MIQSARCRTIAARLVDAKAPSLAGRLDELPARLMQAPSETRLDLLIQELGRIVLLSRAWKANQHDAELTRLIGSSETRDSIIQSSQATRVSSLWEVVGQQVMTRRDGLVSQSTWLLNLEKGIRFALLLDFFPASLGRRSSAFSVGEQLHAELAFYPARHPMRAVIAERKSIEVPLQVEQRQWPEPSQQPMDAYRDALQCAPWTSEFPLLLPSGRIAQSGTQFWWQSSDTTLTLPMTDAHSQHIASIAAQKTVALWDGLALTLLAAQSDWGTFSYVE